MRAVSGMHRNVPVTAGGGNAFATAAAPIAREGYYRHAPLIAAILIAVIAARLHEVLPKVSVLRPALSVGLLGAALILLQTRQHVLREVISHPFLRLLVALMVWATVTAPFALWPTFALSSTFQVLLPILLMTFVILACEPNARNLFLLKVALMASVAAHGAMLLRHRDFESSARMGSVAMLDPNDLALLMVIAFPFAISFALHSRGWRRWLAVFAAVVCLIVVVISGSRGGTLALVATGLVYVASAKGVRRLFAFIVLLACGILTWQLAPQWFRTRMATINTADDYNEWHYDGRKAIWARARGYVRENPVAGVGMLNFPVAEGNTLTTAGERGKWSTTHNSYLQVASELGLVGAAIFLGILGLAIARAMVLRRPHGATPDLRGGQPEFLAAIAGFAAGGYFLSHAYFYAFYALAGVTFFAHRVAMTANVPTVAPLAPVARTRGARGFRSLRTAHLSR